ncbi:hypothetical protein KY285_025490 [Solanum tuberosum]|nr:hypothetical protein KY285_025490 [Solanum tuberosum]
MDKEGKLQARNEQDISNNKQTNKDARIFQQGESSKDWVTRSFGKKNDIIVLDKHAQQRTTNIQKHIKGDEMQQKSNEIEVIDADKGQNTMFSNTNVDRHEAQKNSNEAEVINTIKGQDSESSNINVDRDEAQQKSNEIEVNANDLDEHVVSNNISNQQKDLILSQADYFSNMELAIVKVPNAVQIDESQMIQIESPNRVLHDIVSHNLEEVKSLEAEENQIAKGVIETEESEEIWDYVPIEANISPKLLKCARKGKKQGNGENTQPTRVQPKRVKSVPKRYEGSNLEY